MCTNSCSYLGKCSRLGPQHWQAMAYLELGYVRQLVHVEEDADLGECLLEQLLDGARLVLACHVITIRTQERP